MIKFFPQAVCKQNSSTWKVFPRVFTFHYPKLLKQHSEFQQFHENFLFFPLTCLRPGACSLFAMLCRAIQHTNCRKNCCHANKKDNTFLLLKSEKENKFLYCFTIFTATQYCQYFTVSW